MQVSIIIGRDIRKLKNVFRKNFSSWRWEYNINRTPPARISIKDEKVIDNKSSMKWKKYILMNYKEKWNPTIVERS